MDCRDDGVLPRRIGNSPRDRAPSCGLRKGWRASVLIAVIVSHGGVPDNHARFPLPRGSVPLKDVWEDDRYESFASSKVSSLREHRDGCHYPGERTLSTGGWNRHQRSLHRCFEECCSRSCAHSRGRTCETSWRNSVCADGACTARVRDGHERRAGSTVEPTSSGGTRRGRRVAQDVERTKGFDFRAESEALRLAESTAVDSCPWNGSFYQCSYADATFWGLDRLDQLGRLGQCTPRLRLYDGRVSGSRVRRWIRRTRGSQRVRRSRRIRLQHDS